MRMLRRKVWFVYSLVIIFFCLMFYAIVESFSGAEIQGWGGNVSRNVRDYVSEAVPPHILPENFCKEERLLLVIVCTRPNGFDIRQAIRETWGQKRDNAAFFFLLGEVVNNDLLQMEIDEESSTFDDIIQDNFLDTYNNLTLKSINMLKLFSQHCASTRYLMKVDDDVFLNNIPQLMKKLSHFTNNKNVLLGRRRTRLKPIRSRKSKWYMPYELYSQDMYPDFLCGPAYVMSGNVAQKLYRCALDVPLLPMEDVYLTGICAKRMNVTLRTSSLFTCNAVWKNFCQYTNLYTLHYYSAKDIRDTYEMVKKDYCFNNRYKQFRIVNVFIFFSNLFGREWSSKPFP